MTHADYRPPKHRNARRGYTLLEVMLVLLITMVLVTAVGAALNIYLRSVEAGRAEVEQAQLARALLRRIADDLRSAVPVVVDSSGAEPSTASSALNSAISSAAGGSGGGSSSAASTRTACFEATRSPKTPRRPRPPDP